MIAGPDKLLLRHLIEGLAVPAGQLPSGAVPEIEIRSAVIDSRLVSPGSLFVALRGDRRDGHEFVADATGRGAVAVISERVPEIPCVALSAADGPRAAGEWQPGVPTCFVVPDSLAALQQAAAFWRRQHNVRVIGITGSVGKTTSKEVVAAVLSQQYNTLKSKGNYNNEIGLPLTLLGLTAKHERVVLEMGMYDLGEIAQLAEISRPQVGVVTNVGPSHLERLGTMERIAQAKTELPRALPSAGQGGVAILNEDDPLVKAMAGETQARVFTYGLSPEADLWADEIESEGLEGIRFRLHHRQESIHARLPMLGRHSVHTALRAAAVGLVEGLSWGEIIAGLRDQSAQLRLVAVAGPGGSTILDDTYNSSPASCVAALTLLKELAGREQGGRKIAVLGDMYELGAYEEEAHKLVGRRAGDVVDLLVTVGQLGQIIGREAVKAGMPSESVHVVDTNADAIQVLLSLMGDASGNDMILIKGSRGLAMEEIVTALQRGGDL